MAPRRSPALAEGRSPLKPPFFDGTLYHLWKFQMEVFLKSLDLDLWDIVENGYTPPSKPWPEWTDQFQRAWSLNARAMNALCCGLASREIGRVYACTTASEMWRSLEVFHEGTNQVKKAKIDFLVRRYELFKMRPDESVSEMVARFDEIVSSLKWLGEAKPEDEIVRKVLRSLTKTWDTRVSALQQHTDVYKYSYTELVGLLKSYELRVRGSEEVEDEEESETDDEELVFIIDKVAKLNNGIKEKKDCYECKKPGHIKANCPTNNKASSSSKKLKKKKATREDSE